MKEIKTEQDLSEFLKKKRAILFFHAPWSGYAMISKTMIEFVETYAKTGHEDVSFHFGVFEDERIPLADTLVATGVPATTVFTGNGSLSFFRSGQHIHTLPSVIGNGTFAVWRHIDEIFG